MKTNFLSFIVLISGLLLSSCFPKPIDKSTNENSRGNSELNESVSRTPSYIFTSSSTFYWDSGNIVPPSDVMQEIDYFGGGGGGSTVCHDYPSEYSNRCREDGVELMQRIR